MKRCNHSIATGGVVFFRIFFNATVTTTFVQHSCGAMQKTAIFHCDLQTALIWFFGMQNTPQNLIEEQKRQKIKHMH